MRHFLKWNKWIRSIWHLFREIHHQFKNLHGEKQLWWSLWTTPTVLCANDHWCFFFEEELDPLNGWLHFSLSHQEWFWSLIASYNEPIHVGDTLILCFPNANFKFQSDDLAEPTFSSGHLTLERKWARAEMSMPRLFLPNGSIRE